MLKHDRTPLFEHVDLQIYAGEKYCLVGKNGSGKSSFLKAINGLYEFDHGNVFLKPHIKMSYLPQDIEVKSTETVENYLRRFFPPEEFYKIESWCEQFPVDFSRNMQELSGGELRRVSLMKTLAEEADILLLDEPTNHLDIVIIQRLEECLKKFRGALIIVSHDRQFLKNVTNRMVWLNGQSVYQHDQGFEYLEEWQERLAEEQETALKRLNQQLKEETRWYLKGVTARRKRNQRRLKNLHSLREERQKLLNQQANQNTIEFKSSGRSGQIVIEAKDISKAYGDLQLVKEFSCLVKRKDRIGIVGPNGAGKTTLLKMLLQDLEADQGMVKHGAELDVIYIDQKLDQFSSTSTIKEILCGEADHIYVHGKPRHVTDYMKDFFFKPNQKEQSFYSLSGGEKKRVLLAKLLAKSCNLLILDEPTNDLDLDTIELLRDKLDEFDGTVLIVSHDRTFLDEIVSEYWVFEGQGEVTHYIGDIETYLANKRSAEEPKKKVALDKPKEKSVSTAKPKKLSYKENRDLEILPKEIDQLETDIAAIEQKLADQPDLVQKDYDQFMKFANSLEQMRTDLETKEERWLELEEKREALDKDS